MRVTFALVPPTMLEHVAFRLQRALVEGLPAFLSRSAAPRPFETSAEVRRIVRRAKTNLLDASQPDHFITLHERYAHPNCVLAENVFPYSMNEREIVFVTMPKDRVAYSAALVPFVYIKTFEEAIDIIRMPLESLFRIADELGDPPCRKVVIQNSGRCGSTLVCSMLQAASDEVYAMSELDIFTLMWLFRQTWERSRFEKALRALMRLTFRPPPGKTLVVLKPQFMLIGLADAMHRVMPGIRQFYLYRSPLRTLESYERAFSTTLLFKCLFLMMRLNAWTLGARLLPIPLRPVLLNNVHRLKASNFELGVLIWADHHLTMREMKSRLPALPGICYDDLLANPEDVASRILEMCDLPASACLKGALSAMNADAQRGSPLSREALKDKTASVMNSHDRARINAFCDAVDVPRVFPSG